MATILSRNNWTTTRAGGAAMNMGSSRGTVCHYPAAGRAIGVISQSAEEARLRGWRNYHVGGRGWADLGYNFAIGQSGRIYEGRGLRVGAHATGHNSRTVGVLFIVGDNEPLTEAAKASFRSLRAYLRKKGVGAGVWGHQQMSGASTRCPGPFIMSSIRAGELTTGPTTPTPAPTPAPKPPEGLFGMTLYAPQTRTKNLDLPVGKWKSIPISNTGRSWSILSGLTNGQDITALLTLGLSGLPVGANARVRFYLVSYERGTPTKRLVAHYSTEIVGTAGVTYGQAAHLRKNDWTDGDRSVRLRAEIIVFHKGVELTFAQFNRGKS